MWFPEMERAFNLNSPSKPTGANEAPACLLPLRHSLGVDITLGSSGQWLNQPCPTYHVPPTHLQFQAQSLSTSTETS